MTSRPPPVPDPVPADRVSPPIDADDLFPDPPDDGPTINTSVPFNLSPPLLVRVEVMEQLRALYQSSAKGALGFAVLIGEPGMGKSHLVDRFVHAVSKMEPEPLVLRAAGDGGDLEYAAFRTLLSRRFGISSADSNDAAQQKIAEAAREVLDPAQVTEVTHLLAHLCRVPFDHSPVLEPLEDSPRQLETRMFIAVRRLLAADAGRQPLLLCIDNLELCGPETINLLHYLSAGLSSRPVLILGTGRRSVFARHQAFGQGEVPLTRIELGPLSDEESLRLLDALCEQLEDVPAVLREHATRLGGSPRAIIELLRLLLESEVIVRSGGMSWKVDRELLATLNLPGSHEDLVAERVRVMPGIDADILEKAAAVGEVFWLDAVAALVRIGTHRTGDPDGPTLAEIAAAGDHTRILVAQAIERLVEREWVVAQPESSLPGEREYRFAYPYLWSCVYEGTDAERRRRYHKLVAQWLLLQPEGQDEGAQEAVGRHLELAGDLAGAARCYRIAADAARHGYANDRAIRLYARALGCLDVHDLASRVHLWHDLGSVYELKGDLESALGAYERMLRLSWTASSRAKAAVAFNKMGRVWRRKGDLKLALEYLERAQDLFEQAADTRGIAGSLDDIGQVLYLLGRYEQAQEKIEQALARRGSRGDRRSVAVSLSNLGNIHKDRGAMDEAETCHQRALDIRRAIDDRSGVVASINNLAVLAFERGVYTSAHQSWSEALAEAGALGSLPLQAMALANLGELARIEGRRDDARRRLQEAMTLATEISDPVLMADVGRNLALLEHHHGDHQRARELARKANQVAVSAGLRDHIGRTYLTLGEVYAATVFDAGETGDEPTDPDQPAAERYFSKGIAVLREIGNDAELAKGLERFGRYRIERGDVSAGAALLREALAIFQRLGMAEQELAVDELLGSL